MHTKKTRPQNDGEEIFKKIEKTQAEVKDLLIKMEADPDRKDPMENAWKEYRESKVEEGIYIPEDGDIDKIRVASAKRMNRSKNSARNTVIGSIIRYQAARRDGNRLGIPLKRPGTRTGNEGFRKGRTGYSTCSRNPI